MTEILFLAAVVILAIMAIGYILSTLYRRSNRETAIVRTGMGGKKVIIDGGCLALPLFHDIMEVNMNTLRLEVRRTADDALITADRMRVDVGVEFYVRVASSREGVATAAQTLGDRTWKVDELREMIEGKLIDGLRAVAARMTMDDLHENRANFVQEVQNVVSEDLTKNGLELEAVSLTGLDQTPFSQLDEGNAFNAVGMRRLAEVIAENRKQRAAIEASAEVEVAQRQMEAQRRRFEIEREQTEAKIAEDLAIARLEAQKEASIAEEQARADTLARSAEIEKERALQEANIAKVKVLEEAEIIAEREVELSKQERAIAIATKSEEESKARAKADEARAAATRAEELVITEREVTVAERNKQIEVLKARQDAEREAVRLTALAEAERQAAADKAAAVREEAQAKADAITMAAEAKKLDLLSEAEGREAINDAENKLSEQVIQLRLGMAKIETLPEVLAAMVKPIEKIDGIKIHQISGLQAAGTNGGGGDVVGNGASAGDKPLVNQAIDGLMAMQLQMPAVKKLGAELGISLEDGLDGVTESLMENATLVKETSEPDPKSAAS